MAMQMQSSLGSNLKKTDSDDFKINNLTYGTITKVNYQYSTVEVRTSRTYAGRVNGTDGKYSIPFPRGFTGRTPEGRPFGSTPLIIPGMLVLLGFIEGESGNPIVLSIYSNPEDSKILTPNPLESGDIRNDDVYTYGSMMFSIFPSLNYSFQNGNGTIVRSLNGNSFLSITSEDDEKPMATDFGIGTEYEDLMSSKYGNGEIIESRNQRAPDILFRHTGDLNTNNHITMLQLTEQGTLRFSVLNTETNSRTSWEIDDQGNQRTLSQKDDLIIDNGQDYVEYGIDKEYNDFYIKNGNHDLRFTDQGLLLDGKPMIDDIGNQIDEQLAKLKEIQESLKDVNDLLEDAGKQNLLEVIDASERSEQRSKSALEQVTGLNTQVQQVSSRVEGNITNLNNFMSNINEYVKTNDEIIRDLVRFKDDLNVESIPEIKQTEEKYRQTTFRDIKIHADLPSVFNGYLKLLEGTNSDHIYPQGLAIDNNYLYVLYSYDDKSPGKEKILIVYTVNDFKQHSMYTLSNVASESIVIENEDNKRYLYAKSGNNLLGKYDLTTLSNLPNTPTRIEPIQTFDIPLLYQFSKTKYGWIFELSNNSKGYYNQRDTFGIYNKELTEAIGYFTTHSSIGNLWSNSLTTKSSKRQGMVSYRDSILQVVGGNYDKGSDVGTYHLQGIQKLSPSGEIVDDYTYDPNELIQYLELKNKEVNRIEHEGLYNNNGKIYSIIIYNTTISRTNSNKNGLLLVEYKPQDKEYTFNQQGVPFLTSNSLYNPYMKVVNNKLVNYYNGKPIDSIKELVMYMIDSYQDKVIFYSSWVDILDLEDIKLPNGIKVTLENLDNKIFYLIYEDNYGEIKNKLIVNKSQQTIQINKLNKEKTVRDLDVLTIDYNTEMYSVNSINIPDNIHKNGFIKCRVSDNNRVITYEPFNSYDVYKNIYHTNSWQGWGKISSNLEEQIKDLSSIVNPKDYTAIFTRNSSVTDRGVVFNKNEPIYKDGGIEVFNSLSETLQVPNSVLNLTEGTLSIQIEPTSLSNNTIIDGGGILVQTVNSGQIKATVGGVTIQSSKKIKDNTFNKITIKWSTNSKVLCVMIDNEVDNVTDYISYTGTISDTIKLSTTVDSIIKNLYFVDKPLPTYRVKEEL